MKSYTILLFLIFSYTFLFAQAPTIAWQKTYGGVNADILKSLEKDGGDGFVLAGYSNSPPSGDRLQSINANPFYEIWAIATNENGIINWQNSFGGNNPVQPYNPANSVDNFYPISVHRFDGNYYFGETYLDHDTWYMRTQKCTDSGVFQLSSMPFFQNSCFPTFIDADYTITTDFIKTSDTNFLSSGRTWQGGNCFPGGYIIVKKSSLTVTNSFLWSKSFAGSGDDVLNSSLETTDGGYLLLGHSNSNISGQKTENSNGSYDYWIIKTDSLGNEVWQNTIGGSLIEESCNILQTSDGGYIIGGSSNSPISGDKIENSKGGFDYWIIKISAIGSIEWQKTIGGSLDDKLSKIKLTTDSGYILCGTSNSSISGDKTENSRGNIDNWIVKINKTGSIEWDKTVGGSLDDEAFDILQTNDNGFLLASTSTSSISGEKSENSKGGKDYWIVKLNPENLKIASNNFSIKTKIYPNPTTGIITIDLEKNNSNITIEITNNLGQIIKSEEFNSASQIVLNLEKLSTGIYFIKVENENNEIKIEKLIKD